MRGTGPCTCASLHACEMRPSPVVCWVLAARLLTGGFVHREAMSHPSRGDTSHRTWDEISQAQMCVERPAARIAPAVPASESYAGNTSYQKFENKRSEVRYAPGRSDQVTFLLAAM